MKKKGIKNINDRQIRLIFLLIYLVLSLLLFDPKLFTGGDNAVYITLAQSIISGRGYKNIHLPDEPAHTQYPFGFPLILSLPFFISKNIILLKLIIVLLGLGAFFFFNRIIEYLFEKEKIFIIPFYISVPIFIVYNHWILSEIPFLFFSLAAIFFILKAEREKKNLYLFASVFAVYAFFIRTAGISLIIGIIIYLLIKKRYRELVVFLIIFGAIFIPWQIRNMSIAERNGYLTQLFARNPYQPELGSVTFTDLIIRVWNNLIFYAFTILPQTLIPLLRTKFLLTIFGLFFTGISLFGFLTHLKKLTILELYFIWAIIVLLGWPVVWSSDRFLLPILPIIIIYFFFGLKDLANRIHSRYLLHFLLGIFILLNIIHLIPEITETAANNIEYLKGDRYAGYTRDWKNYFKVIEWIKKQIPEDKVIMARKPEFVYILSRHKSLLYPFTRDHQKIKSAIDDCDYIIYDNFYWTQTTRRYLAPVLQETISQYKVVYKTSRPEFYLLKIQKSKN